MSIKKEQYYLSIWQKVIDSLRASGNVSPEVLQSFFSTSYIESINQTNNSCKVIIVADNIINKSIVSQSDELISSCLIEILDLDCPVSIDIILESEIDTKPKQTLSDDVVNLFNSSEFASMPIQPDRTFDNFVVGDCNKESQAAALACALNPGRYFNPLFIYGNFV